MHSFCRLCVVINVSKGRAEERVVLMSTCVMRCLFSEVDVPIVHALNVRDAIL